MSSSQHLKHDEAHRAAVSLLEIVLPCLTTESERHEFFRMAYATVAEALEKYTDLLRREDARLFRVPSPR